MPFLIIHVYCLWKWGIFIYTFALLFLGTLLSALPHTVIVEFTPLCESIWMEKLNTLFRKRVFLKPAFIPQLGVTSETICVSCQLIFWGFAHSWHKPKCSFAGFSLKVLFFNQDDKMLLLFWVKKGDSCLSKWKTFLMLNYVYWSFLVFL